MPEHYTKATTEASVWCNACGKMTMWRILVGKRAYCIPCHDMRPPGRRTAEDAKNAARDLARRSQLELFKMQERGSHEQPARPHRND